MKLSKIPTHCKYSKDGDTNLILNVLVNTETSETSKWCCNRLIFIRYPSHNSILMQVCRCIFLQCFNAAKLFQKAILIWIHFAKPHTYPLCGSTHFLNIRLWGSPMTWKVICTGCLLSLFPQMPDSQIFKHNCTLKGVKPFIRPPWGTPFFHMHSGWFDNWINYAILQ